MFGRLTLEAFQHDMIENAANLSMVLGAAIAFFLLTYYKKWTWLWKEWLTSVDHKRIGVMYLIVSALMMFKGVIDGVMMRAQQAMAAGQAMG